MDAGETFDGAVLLEMATGLARAASDWTWPPPDGTVRSGRRILATDSYDVWLLRWPPGTSVTPHDHGESVGAFAVASGELAEARWSGDRREERSLSAGEGMIVERGVIHDVVARGSEAVSVHVYSPPLSKMAFFDDSAGSVLYEESVDRSSHTFGGPERPEFGLGEFGEPGLRSGEAVGTGLRPAEFGEPELHPGEAVGTGVDRLLAAARRRIAPRVRAEDLDQAMRDGALVVDTRPAAQRDRDGILPGAVIIERNSLEWRLDPNGSHRIDEATDADRPVIVVCDEGYASSLAAATLLDLGRRNVTDLAGGFQAWRHSTQRLVPGGEWGRLR